MLIFQEKSNGSNEGEPEMDKLKLEEEIKNNRKITDYFNIKSSAKK